MTRRVRDSRSRYGFLCGSEGMVVRRGRHFWLKVLVGLVFAILVLDVLALTYAVVPLAALQQKRAGPTAISRG